MLVSWIQFRLLPCCSRADSIVLSNLGAIMNLRSRLRDTEAATSVYFYLELSGVVALLVQGIVWLLVYGCVLVGPRWWILMVLGVS